MNEKVFEYDVVYKLLQLNTVTITTKEYEQFKATIETQQKAIEFWQQNSTTAWDACEKRRLENIQQLSEYDQLKADAERWRYWIETASGEAAFELTGVTDASNEQINEAIDQARSKK